MSPRLLLLQQARLELSGSTVVELERKTAALLALLAIDGPVSRARAAELLWPDSAEARGRANLRQLLTRLRKAAGAEVVDAGDPLRLAGDVAVDLHSGVSDAPAELSDAQVILAGFDYGDCPELSDWIASAQERLRQVVLTTLEANSERFETSGDYAAALQHAQRALALDPFSERLHRRVMRMQYLLGDRAAALRAYQDCVRLLRKELGVDPDAETRELASTIERGAVPAVAPRDRRRIPPAVLRPPRIVGRSEAWARLERAWEAGRMIFIGGPAGVGKSRLARDFAASKGVSLVIESRPGDAGVPFASQARAVRQVLSTWPELKLSGWVRRELSRMVPELVDRSAPVAPLSSDEERLRFFQAQVELLRGLGASQGQGTIVVVVDDLQYCDPASGEIGHYMFSNHPIGGSDLGIRPVTTFRSGELPPVIADSMQQLIHAGVAELVELTPLDRPAVDELVGDLGLPRVAGLEVAGGLPAVLLELIKNAILSGGIEAGPLPRDVQQVLRERLRSLSAEALRLAQVAAIAGGALSVELAAALLSVQPLELARPWRELETAQILQGDRLVHDLVAEALRADLPSAVVKHLHRSIAAQLERTGAAPTEIARHWRSAGEDEKADAWLLTRRVTLQ